MALLSHRAIPQRYRSSYEAGRRYELSCKQRLEEAGYVVLRTEGSRGFADLVAIRRADGTGGTDLKDRIRFIQCKTRKMSRRQYGLMRELEERLGIRIEVWTKRWPTRRALYRRFSEGRAE